MTPLEFPVVYYRKYLVKMQQTYKKKLKKLEKKAKKLYFVQQFNHN